MAGQRKAEAKRWFQQALYDLKAVEWNIKGGFYDTACFLAQQAAEKALKSVLYYSGSRREALLTHSLVVMVREGEKTVAAAGGLLEEARRLDLHYIPSRYPNGLPSGYPHQFYGKGMADEAFTASEKIILMVRHHYQSQGELDMLQADGV